MYDNNMKYYWEIVRGQIPIRREEEALWSAVSTVGSMSFNSINDLTESM
jgi:hypothetical protein